MLVTNLKYREANILRHTASKWLVYIQRTLFWGWGLRNMLVCVQVQCI